ncbi:MAG: magnesium Mg(2+) and cobalt Co(2+) transport protein CorA [Candidatus Solibacter sp.]|jgi:Mg2+ and Co2+ transporter CorA|nr:magnesium Mg(2+) and cobalt Co(2+) transport protein CorA [Candidatus Solibacter sp.]
MALNDQCRRRAFLRLPDSEALALDEEKRLKVADLSLFVGRDFLITIHNGTVPLLQPLLNSTVTLRLDQVLHGVMDGVPESYLPLIEHLENSIDALHDIVMERRDDAVLEHLGEVRGTPLELRRVLTATR